ncbi:MAG: DUF4926 domain-containing protein [Anaerolineae bacterium]
MLNQHDSVVLMMDLPEYQLHAGALGIVLKVYEENESYAVGCFTRDGRAVTVIVDASQVRPVDGKRQVVTATAV